MKDMWYQTLRHHCRRVYLYVRKSAARVVALKHVWVNNYRLAAPMRDEREVTTTSYAASPVTHWRNWRSLPAPTSLDCAAERGL